MGRKLKFGKTTKILTVRVPKENFQEIKKQINELLRKYQIKEVIEIGR